MKNGNYGMHLLEQILMNIILYMRWFSISILKFIDDDFYQCNDTHVSNYLRKEISDATLKKKSYIFFYKKLDEISLDYDDQIIISPRNTINDSINESTELIDNESSENSQFRRTHSRNSSNNVFPVTTLNKNNSIIHSI